MKPDRIRATRESLELKIESARRKLRGLQSKLAGLREHCPHLNLQSQYVSGDYYSKGYTASRCPDCGFFND